MKKEIQDELDIKISDINSDELTDSDENNDVDTHQISNGQTISTMSICQHF